MKARPFRIIPAWPFLLVGFLVLGPRAICSTPPTDAELALSSQWVAAQFGSPPRLPFRFEVGGRSFVDWLAQRSLRHTSRELDSTRVEHTLSSTDPATGLQVRCVAIEYRDFPTVEWTVYLRNAGPIHSPLVANLLGLDLVIEKPEEGECLLHHFRGSPNSAGDFEPFETPLQPGSVKRITAAGGRPSNSDWPYFNVAWTGGGLVMAVGWPGQWAAEFAQDPSNRLRITAGQERTRFTLRPGEEVRTPLIVLQFYEGDWIRAQNIWRRWMLAYNLPRPGGRLPPVQMAACSSHQFGEMIQANTANQKLFVDRYLEEKLPLDYWWMDAGWYPCDGNWPKTGTWEVDTRRFPGGLRPIADHARAQGVKTIVWFEPERVHSGTWLTENHPEWILGGGNGGLLNLGDQEARRWLTDHVDELLTEQGIDLYRQDFNIDPLAYWRSNDADDRQGITENHHVTGYLAYWDELRRRHPDMLIDSCASGGRRNDLETMRRSVPLLRSDYIMEPVGNQAHTYGLSFWLPYQGTGSGSRDLSPYLLRSTMVTHFTACFDVRRRDLDYNLIRRVLKQWRAYAPHYFGDYYPLTPYSLDPTQWMAWQFDEPEAGEGMVQAFRRDQSTYESARFKLAGLDPQARYLVSNVDSGEQQSFSGRELSERGLSVRITQRPGDAVLTYRPLANRPASNNPNPAANAENADQLRVHAQASRLQVIVDDAEPPLAGPGLEPGETRQIRGKIHRGADDGPVLLKRDARDSQEHPAPRQKADPRITSLSNPAVSYHVPSTAYVVLQRGELEAVVVDNQAVDNAILPGHRSGYHGLASLRHTRQSRNLVVPAYAGLNFEHIHDGTVQPREILFEPRHAPMELRVVSPHVAELYQPPTPHWGLESCMRYELLPEGVVEMTFECIPHRDAFQNGYIGLFWASYIHEPESLDVHFRGRPDSSAGPADWQRGVTPAHGELATHRAIDDDRALAHDPDFPLTLVFGFSDLRYTEPWYFGICRGMAFLQMFRPEDHVRLTQSPSGGGDGCPAWDFQWFIPNPKIGEHYQLRMRAAYVPLNQPNDLDAVRRAALQVVERRGL